MKFGPFVCLPGQLAISSLDGIESWERSAQEIFSMQRHVPWWLGDLVLFGEARFGDDFWQVVPEGTEIKMLQRFAKVASEYRPEERVLELGWAHHSIGLRIKNKALRQAILQVAKSKYMDAKELGKYIERHA